MLSSGTLSSQTALATGEYRACVKSSCCLTRKTIESQSAHRSVSTAAATNRSEVLSRALKLFDMSLLHYLPGNADPDDKSVLETCSREDVKLDEVLSPLVVLLIKLCKYDVGCRKSIRDVLLPPNL